MQRQSLNLVLGAAALALGAAVFFSQKKEAKGPPLTPYTGATLNHVVLDHPGSPAIVLDKQNGRWQLTAPVKTAADPFETNAFPSLATLEVKSTLDPAQVSLKELGLDPPAYTVTLNDQKLAFGGTDPIQSRRYILSNGKIALVDDPPGEALDADDSDLIDKALLPDGAQIASIALPGLTVTRAADGKGWTLTPDRPDVGADARQKLVDGWLHARAMWNAALGKDEAQGDAVTITLKDGTALKFIVAARDPQLKLARPDLNVTYTLSKQLVDELLKLPEPTKAAPPDTKSAAAGDAPKK
ncbi:MAG: DUF4340 domain-containing protein [Nevskiaceae bacterium]|nr:MAG: DUF4340 domain-containing protein [Nevskiaceae bacterium]